MTTRATLTSKGQITIPQEVRQRLGLRQGDQVEFVTDQGQIILKPARGETNPFAAYSGVLGAFDTKEDVDAWVADLRDDSGGLDDA